MRAKALWRFRSGRSFPRMLSGSCNVCESGSLKMKIQNGVIRRASRLVISDYLTGATHNGTLTRNTASHRHRSIAVSETRRLPLVEHLVPAAFSCSGLVVSNSREPQNAVPLRNCLNPEASKDDPPVSCRKYFPAGRGRRHEARADIRLPCICRRLDLRSRRSGEADSFSR